MGQNDYKNAILKGQPMKYQEDEFLINSNSLEKNSIGENNIYHRNFEIIPADSKFPLEEKKRTWTAKTIAQWKEKTETTDVFWKKLSK